MKQTTFSKLRSAVQSIIDCTFLKIEAGGVRATLRRRASPYISHREIVFDAVPERGGVYFQGNYDLVIFASPGEFHPADSGPPDRCGLETEWEVVEVPASMIARLAEIARQAGLEVCLTAGPLTHVAVAVPRLFGWTEYDPDQEISRLPVFRAASGELAGNFVARPTGRCWSIVRRTGDSIFSFPPMVVNLTPYRDPINEEWNRVEDEIK